MRKSSLAVALSLWAASAPAAAQFYRQHNLVSDDPALAPDLVDPNLVNGWGITASATSPWWVSSNGTDLSKLYGGDGVPRALVVQVPGGPTGIVFNGSSSFLVRNGPASGPARFIFASEDGRIRGWNPTVSPPGQSLVMVDNASVGAIYKGLAIALTSSGNFLYAADFHNGRVDVFDGDLTPVTSPDAFVDPELQKGFAPFGLQAITIGGEIQIFVAYAKQDETAHDEIAGQSLGFVSRFGANGAFLGRVATRGQLNAPWGLVFAPTGFGKFSGHLLVGNFGDGQIHAYELLSNGHFEHRGYLKGEDQKPIEIDGLWAIAFGNGAAAGPTTTLFFAAGPGDESHGLFGKIEVAQPAAPEP